MTVLYKIVILIIALLAHELAHGYMAYFCGDKTAKVYGRLSLNPMKHLDPVGTLLPIMMLLSGSSFVIGWAKPVPINYLRLKNGRVGQFLVSIAGVTTNYILAFGMVLLIKYNIFEVNDVTSYFIIMNIVLGTFNLLPIPPLDGSRAIAALINRDDVFKYDKVGMIAILILGYLGILSKILSPIYTQIIDIINLIIRS